MKKTNFILYYKAYFNSFYADKSRIFMNFLSMNFHLWERGVTLTSPSALGGATATFHLAPKSPQLTGVKFLRDHREVL